MTDQSKTDIVKKTAGQSDQPRSFSRRAILKSGATAMPAILTLQSGAAVARSSNLIGEAPAGYSDSTATHTICVDKSTVTDLGSGVYDLGPSRDAHVTMIANDNTYYITQGKNDPIGTRAMCERGSDANGGPFYWHRDGQWYSSKLNQGFVASMGAYSSFAFDVSKSFIE